MKANATKACLAAALAALLAGCATTPSSSGSVYSPSQTRNEQSVRMAVVESVRQVSIEGNEGRLGGLAGGALGGIAGSSVGSGGRSSAAGGVIGAVAGGLAGQAIEQKVTEKQGLEITVRLDGGELRAITQTADEAFKPGERVRLLSSGGVTRVTH